LTTLLAGAEFLSYGAFTRQPHTFADLSFAITAPSVWLFYLAVPTSFLALLRPRPPEAVKRWWTVAAATTAVAVLLPATGVPGLLSDPVDLSAATQTATPRNPGQPEPAPAGPGSLTAADPGRVLTYAAPGRPSARRAPLSRPGGRTTPPRLGSSGPPETISPAACVPLVHMEFLSSLPAPLVQAQGSYGNGPGLMLLGNEALTVHVVSYARIVSSALLAAARQDLRACHRFIMTGSFIGQFSYTAHDGAAPAVGAPAWQADLADTYRSLGSAITWTMVTSGHNLIFITQRTTIEEAVPTPDQAATDAALAAVMAALRHTPETLATGTARR
jgi:hypothetical protein